MREKRYQQAGASPGTLTPLAKAHVPKKIKVVHYTAEAVAQRKLDSVKGLAQYKDADGVTWVNVDGLGNMNIVRELGELFELHPLALEDVLNVPQRPKVDQFDNHLFIVTRVLHFDEELQVEQLSLFLGRNFVVTFQEQPRETLQPLIERIRKRESRHRRLGAGYLAYTVLDAVVDTYYPFLERLGEGIEQLEDEVMDNPTRAALERIRRGRRDLLTLRRCIWPLREVLKGLIRDRNPLLGEASDLYLRDCSDHAVELLDVVATYRDLAGSLMDVYLSSASNKMNEVMKVLTIIATIFIPLTFVVGVYGMNFRHMPETEWPWGYAAVWAVMVVLAIVMLIGFRRKGWLGGGSA